jgi:predicted O-methyltransferase YrrM
MRAYTHIMVEHANVGGQRLDVRIRNSLDNLHRAAKGDRWKITAGIPAVLVGLLRGRDVATSIQSYLQRAFIPVSPESGQFLYLTALAARARNVVEFGTSYGISTLYLAAAARETGGRVIGSEIEPEKLAIARANMEDAGVADIVDIREGDALQSLRDVPDGVDFLLLDGWKDLYQPVLDLLHPKLAPGAVVVADNIFTFKTALRPYVERMQAPGSGFRSTTVAIGEGMEFSVKLA